MTSDQLRAFLLSLPHAKEAQHHGQPDFRVRNKIFANLDDVAGAVTVKLATDAQDALMSRRHEAFSLRAGGPSTAGPRFVSISSTTTRSSTS